MHYLHTRNWHCWDYRAMLYLMRTIQGHTKIVNTSPQKGRGKLTMQHAIPIMKILTQVKSIFVGVAK